jgi:hypothetical protein
MRNTVSLHKVCLAKISGLLVVAALAVVFFVAPMAMAMSGTNPTPTLNSTVKVYFLGKVASNAGTTATNSLLPLALNKVIKPSDVATGSWFLCAVKDSTNTFSIFTCSVASLKSGSKITASAVANNQIGVVLGLPTNVSATSPTAMTYVGKKGRLLYTLQSGLVTTPVGVEQALQATGTGW